MESEEGRGFRLSRNAALALGRIGDQSAVPTLKETVKSDAYDLRLFSAMALGMLGDSTGLPALAECMRGDDGSWRRRVRKVLIDLDTSDARHILAALDGDTLHPVETPTIGRVQCIVHRGLKVLMVRHVHTDEAFWCLPGGGVEAGETPEQTATRELLEECGVAGQIVRELSRFTESGESHYTFQVDIGQQQVALGHDPELAADQQVLQDIAWKGLDELAERDRVYLWTAGLLGVPGFLQEIERWPRQAAYPV